MAIYRQLRAVFEFPAIILHPFLSLPTTPFLDDV